MSLVMGSRLFGMISQRLISWSMSLIKRDCFPVRSRHEFIMFAGIDVSAAAHRYLEIVSDFSVMLRLFSPATKLAV